MSHPTWVRGLKPTFEHFYNLKTFVAPYVGAWIETFDASGVGQAYLVAPYVGAWIETRPVLYCIQPFGSHPTWVRGLKLLKIYLLTPK